MNIKELLNETDHFAALMNQHGELTFGISNNIMFVASAKQGDHLRPQK